MRLVDDADGCSRRYGVRDRRAHLADQTPQWCLGRQAGQGEQRADHFLAGGAGARTAVDAEMDPARQLVTHDRRER